MGLKALNFETDKEGERRSRETLRREVGREWSCRSSCEDLTWQETCVRRNEGEMDGLEVWNEAGGRFSGAGKPGAIIEM